MRKIISSLISRIRRPKNNKEQNFEVNKDPVTSLTIRSYKSYSDYLSHQASKLQKQFEDISRSDKEYEEIVVNRYERVANFAGKNVLCLGARLGGEVRAFKRLGGVAVGVDLNPGDNNNHVLFGDVHDIQFPDHSFDFIFSNIIDHVLDIPKFMNEVKRLLRNNGRVLLECAQAPMKPNKYEVVDLSSLTSLRSFFLNEFDILEEEEILNKGSYINWTGKLFILGLK